MAQGRGRVVRVKVRNLMKDQLSRAFQVLIENLLFPLSKKGSKVKDSGRELT